MMFKTMRPFLLVVNAAVALLFIALFAFTFTGRQQIDAMAREFVSAKTQKFITPAVNVADEALRLDATRRFLKKDQVAAIESEIAEFRLQPTQYVQRLTSARAEPKPETFLFKLSEKIFGWKERIRIHYNEVLKRLFTDLRIFAGSNVVAACIAFVCAWRCTGNPSLQLTLISLLLLAAIGFSIHSYVDSFSFFTILFDWYLGWTYPISLGFLFISFYLEYGLNRKEEPDRVGA